MRIHNLALELELETAVLRVIRYRARCSCGWLGRSWSAYGTAAAEARWHRG